MLRTRPDEIYWETTGIDLELAERGGFDGFFGPLPEAPAEAADGGGSASIGGPAGPMAPGWRYPGPQLLCKLAKWQQCGHYHSPKRYHGPTLASSPVETRNEDVFVALLDPTRAEGLNLSFLTHMFLLGHIEDAARLEQVFLFLCV